MPNFDPTSASRAVLIEVMNVLGAFRDKIVLIGGWVPDLLYPNSGHIGSLDVDLAVSQIAIGSNAYETILKRMIEAGYEHHASPTRFTKTVAGVKEPVKVDLIGGQYVAGEKTQTIQVNELGLNTLRGIDLAFEVCQNLQISGMMPDGSQNTVQIRIVLPEGYILIKAFGVFSSGPLLSGTKGFFCSCCGMLVTLVVQQPKFPSFWNIALFWNSDPSEFMKSWRLPIMFKGNS